MYKKELSYKDYNGQQRTETFWFHLNQVELVDIEVSVDSNGLASYLDYLQKSNDRAKIISFFKMLIQKSFGKKTEDGRFVKSDRIWEEFSSTAAYPALFMTLMKSEIEMEAFTNGIVPADIREQMTVNKKNSVESPSERNESALPYVPES